MLVSAGTISRTSSIGRPSRRRFSARNGGTVRFLVLVSSRYSAYVTTMECGRMRYLTGTSLNFQIDHDG